MSALSRLAILTLSITLSATHTAAAEQPTQTLPPLQSIPVLIEQAPPAPALYDLMPLQRLNTHSQSFFDYQQLRLGDPIPNATTWLQPAKGDNIKIIQLHALEKRINIKGGSAHFNLDTSYRLIAHKHAPSRVEALEVTHFSDQLPRSALQQKLQHALTNKFGHPLLFQQFKSFYLDALKTQRREQQKQRALMQQRADENPALLLFVTRLQWRMEGMDRRIAEINEASQIAAADFCQALRLSAPYCQLRGVVRANKDGQLVFGHSECQIWLRNDLEMLSLCPASGAMVVRITSPSVSRWHQEQTRTKQKQLKLSL